VSADPLDPLLLDGIIDEVLGRLKSGKEADIYLVRHAGAVVAAKVYKDPDQRSFKNNSDYKEGRKVRNSRTQRAMDSRSGFGRKIAEQAWRTTEADALNKLFSQGVRVPEPVLFYEGVLLMQLVTDDEGNPAPRLIDVAIDPAATQKIFLDLRAQIIKMLCCEVIHGDLSPYNILAAAAGPTIIDFPQVVSPAHSSRAQFFFERDFTNVHAHLLASDRSLQANAGDGRKIWQAYVRRDLSPDFVPPVDRPTSRPQPRPLPPRPHVRPTGPPAPRAASAPPAQPRPTAGTPSPRPSSPTGEPRRRRRRR
jgi:RIO kinase 1